MSRRSLALGVFTLLLLLAAVAFAYAAFKDIAKTDVNVKTGKWSYEIKGAQHQGQCRRGKVEGKVEVAYTAREVSVKFYGCDVAPVKIEIRADSTVPICLTPEGPANGPASIPLRPGVVVERTYVFYENGTLKFAVKIGDC